MDFIHGGGISIGEYTWHGSTHPQGIKLLDVPNPEAMVVDFFNHRTVSPYMLFLFTTISIQRAELLPNGAQKSNRVALLSCGSTTDAVNVNNQYIDEQLENRQLMYPVYQRLQHFGFKRVLAGNVN